MQSSALCSLQAPPSSGLCSGCCGVAAGVLQRRRHDSHATRPSTSPEPEPASPVDALFPPPRFCSPEHAPAHDASSSHAYILVAKRLTLSRTRLPPSARVRPSRGDPSEEVELQPVEGDSGSASVTPGASSDIDLRQFKAVRAASPSGSSVSRRRSSSSSSLTLHKLYLDLWPNWTYKFKFSSARERDVWIDILSAYGKYGEQGSVQAAGSRRGSRSVNGREQQQLQQQHQQQQHEQDPKSFAAAAAAASPASPHAAALFAASHPYSSYALPSLYVRSLHTLLATLVSQRAFLREGLFRTGRSSSTLLRQLLLNGGQLEGGGTWRRSQHQQQKQLDPHTLAFLAKTLLRSLPESLLTNALFPHIFWAAGAQDRPLLRSLLLHLPSTNLDLLRRVFELLSALVASPSSRMTPLSLAKVVGPNFLPHTERAEWIRAMDVRAEGERGRGREGGTAGGSSAAPAPVVADGDAPAAVAASAASSSSAPAAAAASDAPNHSFPSVPGANDIPAPSSVPMLSFFSILLDDPLFARELWPSSLIWAPGGMDRLLASPLEQEEEEDEMRMRYTYAPQGGGDENGGGRQRNGMSVSLHSPYGNGGGSSSSGLSSHDAAAARARAEVLAQTGLSPVTEERMSRMQITPSMSSAANNGVSSAPSSSHVGVGSGPFSAVSSGGGGGGMSTPGGEHLSPASGQGHQQQPYLNHAGTISPQATTLSHGAAVLTPGGSMLNPIAEQHAQHQQQHHLTPSPVPSALDDSSSSSMLLSNGSFRSDGAPSPTVGPAATPAATARAARTSVSQRGGDSASVAFPLFHDEADDDAKTTATLHEAERKTADVE